MTMSAPRDSMSDFSHQVSSEPELASLIQQSNRLCWPGQKASFSISFLRRSRRSESQTSFPSKGILALQRLEIITRICSDLAILVFDLLQRAYTQKPFVENVDMQRSSHKANRADDKPHRYSSHRVFPTY